MMFPTHVGMNRRMWEAGEDITNVPYTRGDEPIIRVVGTPDLGCSLHTWG